MQLALLLILSSLSNFCYGPNRVYQDNVRLILLFVVEIRMFTQLCSQRTFFLFAAGKQIICKQNVSRADLISRVSLKKLGNTATTTVFLSTKRLKYFFGNTRKIWNLHSLLFQALSHGNGKRCNSVAATFRTLKHCCLKSS